MKNNLHVFLGATVADAAARPLHWVYNQKKLLTYIKGKEDFTFLKKNRSPFYNIKTGKVSGYNDVGQVMFTTLIEGHKNIEKRFKKNITKNFGPGSKYWKNLKLRKKYKKVRNWRSLIKGPWIHQNIIESIKNIRSNKKIELAFLPRFTGVDIRISSHREIDLDNFHSDLFSMLSKYIYADSSKDIENIIGDLMKDKKLTLSTAESCTGGLIADRLTNIPGSSAFFRGGIIAYSNDVKISDLGVSEKILNKKGAVSSDVAKDMAKGIRQKYNTNIGLSTTGIAGPEGGSIDKPVGLVYIGLSTEDREESFKFNFSISRKKNKLMFSQGALNILREYLLPL